MEWIADVSAGAWLRPLLDDGHGTMHDVVPHGYAAYARILHPPHVQWLPDRPMPSQEEWERMPESERQRLVERMADADTTWAATAAAFGTTLHPLAQWQRIVRTPTDGDWHTRIAPDGREYGAPEEGSMPPPSLAPLAEHLVGHTTTPDDGFAALWEGWGGLLGFYGETPARMFLSFSDDPRHRAMLDRSTHDPFNNVFRKPVWQDGILSKEISEGPRLRLPDRDHVLFSVAPAAFADPDWVLDAPWRDRMSEQHGFPPEAQHPSILWPADRAWVMVSEIDFDSTIVAGSAALVAAICADGRIEALPIREGADLTWDADDVNR